MKKVIMLIFILAFTTLSTMAKLPTNIMGFHLGNTSQEEVINGILAKGLECKTRGNRCYLIPKKAKDMVKFNGYLWECVMFEFQENKLVHVSFGTFAYNNDDDKDIALRFSHLSGFLEASYGEYRIKMTPRQKSWMDQNTKVSLSYSLDQHERGQIFLDYSLSSEKQYDTM